MSLASEWVADASPGAVRAAVEALLVRVPVASADHVVLVPDAHYPFHPSTGLVTNPAVVEALARTLLAEGATVDVGFPPSPWLDVERTRRFLGYVGLADRLGLDLLDLVPAREADRRRFAVDGQVATLGVPSALVDANVVVVPSLRTDPRQGVAGALATLAAALADGAPSPAQVAAATSALQPTLGVVDATYSYAGEPRASDFLLAGTDLRELDRAAAVLLSTDTAAIPALVRSTGTERPLPSVDGPPLSALAATVADGRAPDVSDPGWPMRAGYRLYARLTGDVVPPQFLEATDG